MAAKSKSSVIELPALERTKLRIKIVGDTALLCHHWDDVIVQQLADKQQGKAKTGTKDNRTPKEHFEASLYRLPSGQGYGFPARAFKKAAVTAANDVGLKQTEARRMFFVHSAPDCGDLIPLTGAPRIRQDVVSLGTRSTMVRYRGEFPEWSTEIVVEFNAGIVSAEQVVNLINLAGMSVGVGDWRPEKNGTFGMFHVGGKEE